jgi:hypothetical protein
MGKRKATPKQVVLLLRTKGNYIYDDRIGTLVIAYQNRYFLTRNDDYYEEHVDMDSALSTAIKLTDSIKSKSL